MTYTKMSIKQLKCAIYAEQSKDSLVKWVWQRLATSIKNRNNLAESEMINKDIDMNLKMIMTSEMQLKVITIQSDMNMNSEIIITSEMQLRVITMHLKVLKCWKDIDDVIHYNSKVYVLQNSALHNAVISQFHNDVFTDYFEKSKTAELMCQFYDWSDTVRDIQHYCHNCVEYQKTKSAHHKLYKLLNSLLVLTVLWHTVTMNFITDLSLSSIYRSTIWDSILVVINKLIKITHYISVQKTMSVTDFIEVFIRDIIKHYSVSEVLVTDRDKLFMSEQWTSFCFYMQCYCNILTAFHLQTDD